MIEFVRTRPWLNLGIASIALTVLSIMTSSVIFPMSILGVLGTNTVLEIALTFGFSSLYVMGAHTAYIVGHAVSNHWNSKPVPVKNAEQPSLSSEVPKSVPSLEPALTTTPKSEKDLIILDGDYLDEDYLDEDYLDEDDIYISRVSGAGIEITPDRPEDSPIRTPIRTPEASIAPSPSLLVETPVLVAVPASPKTPLFSPIGTPIAISPSFLKSDFNRTPNISPNISPLQLTPEIPDSPIGSTITPVEAPQQISEVSETLEALHRTVDRALEVAQPPIVKSLPEVLAGTPNNVVRSPATTPRQATSPQVLSGVLPGTPTRTYTPISEMYTPSDSPVGSPNVSRSNGVRRSKAPVLNGFNHKRNSTPVKPCHICSDNSFEAKKYGSMFEDKNGTTVRKSARTRSMAKYS